jgi:hypothetical protein
VKRIHSGLLVTVVIAIIAFVPIWKIIDDGLWPVTVTVHPTSDQPIKAVSAKAFSSVEEARETMADLPLPCVTRADYPRTASVQEPWPGQPLEVKIPTSEKTYRSLVWTWQRFYQFRGLLVVVEYEDGKLEGRAVELPDLRQARSVTIEVP